MNNKAVVGPIEEAECLRREVPALCALLPIEERGRHYLLQVAASLAEGLPDAYARELARAAAVLHLHLFAVTERVRYAREEGTVARISGRAFALGTIAYLSELALHPRLAERNAALALQRDGCTVFGVIDEHDGHCLGIIGIMLPPA